MTEKLTTIVLLSGSGRTLENFSLHIDQHDLPMQIELVISSRPDAYGLERARARGVATEVVPSAEYRIRQADDSTRPDWTAMSEALNQFILPRQPQLVCLAGYMCFYQVPAALSGQVINIHPALLPKYGGRGMYGEHVHQAVLAAAEDTSGCTVHFVSNEYDAGEIILQRECSVMPTDTSADLAARVFELECAAYPEAIRQLASGQVALGNENENEPAKENR